MHTKFYLFSSQYIDIKTVLCCCLTAILLFFPCLSTNAALFTAAVPSKQSSAVQTSSVSLDLYAKAAVLMDGETGRILYAKNAEEILPMASTTKIMTCIVALEYGNLDDLVTISSEAASQPKVHLGVSAGEQYQLGDLLYSLMLESHNDSAVAIAEHIGGSVPGFAQMMNQKARDLGCYDSYFITPNGLDAQDETGVHSTTAADLANMLRYAIKNEAFLTITRTSSYSFTDAKGQRNFSVNNKNAFLSQMEGALSGKTGFTGNAGYCYVGALKQGDKTLIAAVLACGWPPNKSYKWSDTRKLMTYGLENFEYQEINADSVLLPDIPVTDGIIDSVSLYTDTEPFRILTAPEDTLEVTVETIKGLTAPVEKDTIVGRVNYRLNGETWMSYPIYTTSASEKITYQWQFNQVIRVFLFGLDLSLFLNP